jgi:hypothetical protein
MRARKSILGLLLILAFSGFWGEKAFATEAWYTCTIVRVGGATVSSGSFYIRLTDTQGAFVDRAFKIPEDRLDKILMVALTAAASGSTVYVKADPVAKTLAAFYYNVN